MKKKISTDLSKLSNLDETHLDKLLSLCGDIIGSSVYESILNNDDITELDFGFGKLIIKTDLKDVKMKFIPSNDLELDLKSINSGHEPSLKHKLEKAISAKLVEMYKGLI